MRTADTILGIIRTRGEQRLPLEDVYRQLYNPNLYLRSYGRIYKNDGALTKGTTDETVDGMSQAKIDAIIEAIRFERFQWTPVRRVEIPKKDGRTRPLGLPTWTDKMVQDVVRSILEAYYEPQFSNCSHGFRPNRGCHSALNDIYRTWKGTKWFIEGDIKGCFDNIDHDKLMERLREDIHDNRFLRLMENLLKAGYCEQWNYHPTLSGTPQGGIVSPILANIYLDRLDRYVEDTLIPEYTRGTLRKGNQQYVRLKGQAWYHDHRGNHERARELRKQARQLPSIDPNDPGYRRLRYVRYADDFLLGFAGPKAEADEIRDKLRKFLDDELNLELSEAKTLITHATDEAACFLGYELSAMHANDKITTGQRAVNGVIKLKMPLKFVEERCALYRKDGKPVHRAALLNDEDFSIISKYQSELRGYYQYYQMAQNVCTLTMVKRDMEVSLLKTLASKHKTSVNKIVGKYKTTTQTPNGPRRCVELVIKRHGKKDLTTRFGGFPLKRNLDAVIVDNPMQNIIPRNELLKRVLAEECEACGAQGQVEVHHVRKLADLKMNGRKAKPLWMQVMAARRRKTLVLCLRCHDDLHAGRPVRFRDKGEELLESRVP